MDILEVFFLAIGLSMDAFAVSVCKGLAMKKISFQKAAVCGIWFGTFQALMPMIGYLLGTRFQKYIEIIAPWVAFVLLAIIGGEMIWEAVRGEAEEASDQTDVRTMFVLAVATSIDALAVGITFACLRMRVLPWGSQLLNVAVSVLIIGAITFCLSCAGVKVGNVFGIKYKSRAELAGGAILVILGLKILLEHYIG